MTGRQIEYCGYKRAMNRTVDVVSSSLVSAAAWGLGWNVATHARTPARLLELYEFEACPFCRKVREALTMFDLGAMVYPCPPGGTRFRPRVVEMGGKAMFPFLVDPNSERQMYESDEIVKYLAQTYGTGEVPLGLRLGPLTTMRSVAASALRPTMGRLRPSREPKEPLELYSFEVSPYSRLVREALSSLELPYRLHNLGRGSAFRAEFVARSGKMMVPYLVDPNENVEMFESAEIVRYLERTYAQ